MIFQQGPNNAIALTNAGSGPFPWQSPVNAQTFGGGSAYIQFTGSSPSATGDFLFTQDFGFNVPSSGIVVGIQIDVRKSRSGPPGGNIKDVKAELILVSDLSVNKASASNWPASFETITYGGSGDLWGLTPDFNDVNGFNFKFRISAQKLDSSNPTFANIDHIQATVFYDIPSANSLLDLSIPFVFDIDNNSADFFISGYEKTDLVMPNVFDIESQSTTLFLQNYQQTSLAMPNTFGVIEQSVPLFITNYFHTLLSMPNTFDVIEDSIPLALENYPNIPLSIFNIFDVQSNDITLFMHGHEFFSTVAPFFIGVPFTKEVIAEQMPLFINVLNPSPFQDSINLFTFASWPGQNLIFSQSDLFLMGPLESGVNTDNMNLFIFGPTSAITLNNMNLVLKNITPSIDGSIPLFMSNLFQSSTNNIPLIITAPGTTPGATPFNNNFMNLFIHRPIRIDLSLFINGPPTPINNLIDLFIKGQIQSNNNIELVMPNTFAEISKVFTIYSRGF